MPCGAGSACARVDSPTTKPRRGAPIGVAALSALLLTGCAAKQTRIELVDFRDDGPAKRYGENFEEAYYDLDDRGNIDLVLRRDAPDTEISQIVHVRSIWCSIPGRTIAHTTQINGTITYGITSGQVGTRLEGAGSVFFKENREKNQITGTIGTAVLKPCRHLASDNPVFNKVELQGSFVAQRDPRRVRRIIHELDRRSSR